MQPHRVRRHLQSPLRRSPDPDAGVKRPSRFAINDEMLVSVPLRSFRYPADPTPTTDCGVCQHVIRKVDFIEEVGRWPMSRTGNGANHGRR
jgi:hypothetical protein